MKKFILSFIVMFAFTATATMAQDDMYFVPKKETKAEKAARKATEDSLRAVENARRELAEKIAFEKQQREYEDMMVRMYRRIYHEDVDIYNRHFSYEPSDSLVFDSLNTGDDRFAFSNINDTLYNVNDNYKFMKMISRFEDFDIRYYPNDSFYWHDPWYYSPSRYWGWNYGYRHFYNPFSPYWGYGYYDPFFYGRDPWWYTWYDPFYDGFYGWGWNYAWGWRPYYDSYYVPNYGYIGHHGGIHHGTPGTNLPRMAGTTHHGGWNTTVRRHGTYNSSSNGSRYGSTGYTSGSSTPRNNYWGNSSSNRISSSSSSSSSSRSYSTPSTSHSSGYSSGGGFSGGGHGGGSRSTGGRH